MEYKNIYTYKNFILEKNNNISDDKELNEGVFGKMFSWAGNLIKQGKIKNALKKQTDELIPKMKERLAKEFEIELTKKTNGNTTTLDEELSTLQEEEQNIKDELTNAIQEVIKKKPDLKLKLKKLEIQEKKSMLAKKKEMLAEFSKDEKYGDIADVIKDRIKTTQENDNKLEQELKGISEGKHLSSGDVYTYINKKQEETKVILSKVEYENEDEKKIKYIKGYKLHIKDDDTHNIKIGDEFTMVLDNIKNKIENKDIEIIFGSLDKYNEFKEKIKTDPDSLKEEE